MLAPTETAAAETFIPEEQSRSDEAKTWQTLLDAPNAGDVGAQFEELLESVGKFGRYQQVIVFGVLLPAIFAYAFSQGFWLFVIATPESFWCHVAANHTSSLGFSNNITRKILDQQCHEYISSPNSTLSINVDIATANTCQNGWDYDQSVYTSTIVSEWNLVCAWDFLPTLMYIITTIVGTLGAPLGGYCSDHYGRKRTYYGFLAIEVVAGIAVALAPSYVWFVVLACVHSLAVYPAYQTIYTLGIEILTPEHRTTFSVLVGVSYSFGSIASCGMAYLLRDWRTLILASTIPLVALLGLFPVMPESPRFDLNQRKFHEVEQFFRRACKWEGTDFDSDCKSKLHLFVRNLNCKDAAPESSTKSYSFRDLFQHRDLCRRTFILVTLSATVAVFYGGLDYLAPKLGSNPHLNVFLTSLVDLPASLLTQLVADRLGRRLTLAVNFIFGGLFCLSSIFFPPDDEQSYYPILVLFLFARMFAVSSYTVEELVSCESFPTVLRGEGISLTNGVSGVVSGLGPMIVYLSDGTQWTSPMAWFGGMAILGSSLVFFLPETVDRSLPETLEDVEPFVILRSFKELIAPMKRKNVQIQK